MKSVAVDTKTKKREEVPNGTKQKEGVVEALCDASNNIFLLSIITATETLGCVSWDPRPGYCSLPTIDIWKAHFTSILYCLV